MGTREIEAGMTRWSGFSPDSGPHGHLGSAPQDASKAAVETAAAQAEGTVRSLGPRYPGLLSGKTSASTGGLRLFLFYFSKTLFYNADSPASAFPSAVIVHLVRKTHSSQDLGVFFFFFGGGG